MTHTIVANKCFSLWRCLWFAQFVRSFWETAFFAYIWSKTIKHWTNIACIVTLKKRTWVMVLSSLKPLFRLKYQNHIPQNFQKTRKARLQILLSIQGINLKIRNKVSLTKGPKKAHLLKIVVKPAKAKKNFHQVKELFRCEPKSTTQYLTNSYPFLST